MKRQAACECVRQSVFVDKETCATLNEWRCTVCMAGRPRTTERWMYNLMQSDDTPTTLNQLWRVNKTLHTVYIWHCISQMFSQTSFFISAGPKFDIGRKWHFSWNLENVHARAYPLIGRYACVLHAIRVGIDEFYWRNVVPERTHALHYSVTQKEIQFTISKCAA